MQVPSSQIPLIYQPQSHADFDLRIEVKAPSEI
jgi:hypothetical protein